jgi:flagellar hook-associated protein 2
MANLGLAGIASGVDTNAIVDQLMALERQSLTRLGYRQASLTGQQNALKDVASKLAALKDAAAALRSDSTWKQSQSVESSDPTRVAVALTGGAGIGGHTIQVDRLASSMQRGYSFSGATGGTLTISYAAGEPKQIDVTVAPGATVKDVADAINAKSDGPVVAAVVKNGLGEDRLVLSSRKTGSSSDFTVSGTGVLTEDGAYATPDPTKLDASYSLDGNPAQTSQTNILENVIPGLRVTLKAVTAAPATVTVGSPDLDRAGVKAKVKAFVDAYNAVVDTTRAKLTEKPVSSPGSESQAARGQLFGDTGLSSMLSALRQEMGEIVAGTGINDLGDLGISVPKTTGGAISEDGRAGRLVLDEAKLTEALEADWTAVRGFFDGFADEVDAFVKKQTGGSGVIDDRLKNADRSHDRLQDQIERTNERLDLKEQRMRAQFAAMEVALQNAQSQQAWLTGQLAALERDTGR